MICNESTLILMSDLCLHDFETVKDECGKIDRNLIHISGVWCVVNSVIGMSGNLLTILAIPFCAREKKFNLHINWTNTFYIVNLALADFIYCAIDLPLYAVQYLSSQPPFSDFGCYWSTAFRFSRKKTCEIRNGNILF